MKPIWTDEQLRAINEDNSNIIISAGAGSGKTAVLSERVLRKIKENVKINQLLILTFTNAAAKEMKDRIRRKLIENNYIEDVNLIDSAYITTFDSFALSVVKKYHTNLNITNKIEITDFSIIAIKKNEIINNIFAEYYQKKDLKFLNLIKNFCVKDDKKLIENIINISNQLDMKYKKDIYLEEYFSNYLNDDFIKEKIKEYFFIIKNLINELEGITEELSNYITSEEYEKLYNSHLPWYSASSYDEIVKLSFDTVRLKTEDSDAIKLKEKIKKIKNKIDDYINFVSEEEIYNELLSTKDNVEVIIKILQELEIRLNIYKQEESVYSFNDISLMAIKVVEENLEIKEELTNKFNEIMIDEYQDTNDIGEYFISLITKNNLYMVGDIKQSIYRFRNANPYIFKNKYDKYSLLEGGKKIDLNKNFRSRDKVLDNINNLFDYLMDDNLGGAKYREEHQMIFGNKTYINEGLTEQDYDLSIYNYTPSKECTNAEKEIFIIGEDIKQKINDKFLIFNKSNKELREVKYSDFVILIDRKTDFDLYKKIFEYLNIPINLEKSEEIKQDNDILLIKNIVTLANLIKSNTYDIDFKYCFISVARSFLFNYTDDEIFNYFYTNNFKENEIYEKTFKLSSYIDELSSSEFLLKLEEIFEYELNLIKIGSINSNRKRFEYFYNLISDMEKKGETINDFINYLDVIFNDNKKIEFKTNEESSNSVTLMTIHASKGLEFPICYFSGFKKEFMFQELKEDIIYSKEEGIILPYFNKYIKNTILKDIYINKTKQEEISEKIRLLYVALTRAEEKMIIVTPNLEDDNLNISSYDKVNYKSFYTMLNSLSIYLKKHNISKDDVLVTKDYLKNNSKKLLNEVSKDIINLEEINIKEEEVQEKRYSKDQMKLISKEEAILMNKGNQIHQVLELIDFKNPDFEDMELETINLVKDFLNQDIIKNNINENFYKEYEFIYQEDNINKHGIIDLLIENNNQIIIIDYKLNNINDEAYIKQLYGYKEFIKQKTNKEIKCYLYSIIKKTFLEI